MKQFLTMFIALSLTTHIFCQEKQLAHSLTKTDEKLTCDEGKGNSPSSKKLPESSILVSNKLLVELNHKESYNSEQITNDDSLNFKIVTADIDNFWLAYDKLKNTKDSIQTIQNLYIDKASPELLEIIKIRPDFTAANFVKAINKYPSFWNSVRNCTKSINKKKELISKAFVEIKHLYPDFESPDICFGITPASFGGTTSDDNKILFIGSEIVLADSNVVVSEFDNILKDIIGTLEVLPYIIHESVHTAQRPMCEPSVMAETLLEGSADFIASYILKNNFNKKIYEYGYKNECKIWKAIKPDIEKDQNYGKWFGNYNSNEHPDLGYFIGYRIVQSYYEKVKDKKQALIDIIEMKYPQKILDKSSYNGNCGN